MKVYVLFEEVPTYGDYEAPKMLSIHSTFESAKEKTDIICNNESVSCYIDDFDGHVCYRLRYEKTEHRYSIVECKVQE